MNFRFLTFLTTIWTGFAAVSASASPGQTQTNRVTALIVVDVQNCFITGNMALSKSPAKQDGAKVIPVLNDLIKNGSFDFIVYTHDWHPSNHISFFDNLQSRRKYLKGNTDQTIKMYDEVTYSGPKVETKQILWPSHCVQNTHDAKLHKDLYIPPTQEKIIHVTKGTDPDIDSYSAFFDNNQLSKTELDNELRKRHVTDVFVAGLATDYCVGGTASDAFNLNYRTYLIEDASGIIAFETAKAQLDRLKQQGVKIIQANQVKGLISSANGIYHNIFVVTSVNLLFLLLK